MKQESSTTRYRAYWRHCLRVTVLLLLVWGVVTFGVGYYARELNAVIFLGFPLGFYMSGQGSLLMYALIVGIYAVYMDRLDRRYGVAEGSE